MQKHEKFNNNELPNGPNHDLQNVPYFSTQTHPHIPSNVWSRDKKILYTVNDVTKHRAAKANHSETNNTHRHENNSRQTDHNTKSNNVIDSSSNNKSQTSTTNSQQPSSNSTIIGHYELKKTLGKGNFSTVKLAQHRITQHLVAIKVVKTSVLSEDNLMKINREIDVLKKIRKHDHIVRLYQVIETKRYFMLVTEYCANGELYDYLVKKGKLSEPQSCNYFLQILSAVEYLHDHNVVHRDLKAENLLLTNDYKTVKIADFGFANYYKNDKLLSTWCGSPPYAAPELFKGLQYLGPPVDIWSMGVILYVLVCGSLPFDGHNLVYLKSRVLSGKFRIPFFMSTECEGLIRAMLRLDPDRRFSIRQIRLHSWTVKHGNSKKEANVEAKSPEVFMEATNNSANNVSSGNEVSSNQASNTKQLDKSSYSRGQSLELEDDKKTKSAESPKDDALILYNDDKSISGSGQGNEKLKPSRIQNLVNTEIVNAVSNMSLDSNNSAMSISQKSIDTTTTLGSSISTVASSKVSERGVDTGNQQLVRKFSKENSIDDQIIEFMVDNLKVADSRNLIRQSIANDKYDDLHAMYRLLRDQPKIVFDALALAKFKIPSLPLISLNTQQNAKKPSITTGFFNQTIDNTNTPAESHQTENKTQNSDSSMTNETGAINLITHSQSKESKFTRIRALQRKSEDQTWKAPPQLFLTPPCEISTQTALKKTGNEPDPTENTSPTMTRAYHVFEPKLVVARHSFDSTMQQSNNDFGGIPGTSSNKLALTNCAKHCLWDSSILDTLGHSTSPLNVSQTPVVRMEDNNNNNFDFPIVQRKLVMNNENTSHLDQNLKGFTTNLPQIGALNDGSNLIDQNLLLAQLNSLASSATMTQSSMLTQCYSDEQKFQEANPIKFTPNNLINQNYNVMNTNTTQNTSNNPCTPNLSLLDPNGLISRLERRASDGQASYSSLTTTNPSNNENLSIEPGTICANTMCDASAFLSSSSNQLSSSFNRYRSNTVQMSNQVHKNGDQMNHQTQSLSNNSMISTSQLDERNGSNPSDVRVPDNDHPQDNPLDLTKGSIDGSQQEMDSTNGARSCKRQLFRKAINQRSNSTTSASIISPNLPSSATTSPRSSLFMRSATNNNIQIPFCQVSPSSVSLTGGGPGHLLNRRKRHSFENETRQLHYKQQQQQTHNQYPTTPNSYLMKSHDESGRPSRQYSPQYYKYPPNSHIGRLRNFAQTFSYKKLDKKQATPNIWDESVNPPPVMTGIIDGPSNATSETTKRD